MPVRLRLEPMVRQPARGDRNPLWRRLHRIADQLFLPLRTLWDSHFADFRAALPLSTLTDALQQQSLLTLEPVIHAAWDAQLVRTRRVLLALWEEGATDAAQASVEAVAGQLGIPSEAALPLAAEGQRPELSATVGAELAGITARTLATIRQAARVGFQSGTTLAQQASRLARSLGLTSRQVRTLDHHIADRLAQGIAPGRVSREADALARRALIYRVEQIAKTESIDIVNQGQQGLLDALRQSGLLPANTRRFWIVTPDDRLCPICAAIPGLNPHGVGVDEPFQTTLGPIFAPTAHPLCRCALDTRRV